LAINCHTDFKLELDILGVQCIVSCFSGTNQ
jgi:hypothetical protein